MNILDDSLVEKGTPRRAIVNSALIFAALAVVILVRLQERVESSTNATGRSFAVTSLQR